MRRPTMTENKLLVLFGLKQLGPVSDQQLLRFLVECALMDYIEMQLCLGELRESGMLRTLPDVQGEKMTLSVEGIETIELFTSYLPASRRDIICEKAPDFRRRFKRESDIHSNYAEENGAYTVHLSLTEHPLTLLDLKLSVPTREQAKAFCTHFCEHADTLYAQIIHTLGEGGEADD